MTESQAKITLGAGCFWCLEAVYEQVLGVTAVESGYANGHTPHPSYEQVCSGQTGYNEVVQVSFDPARISLREILEIFFVVHDPTSLNRQGNDVGTQYRSGVYTVSAEQAEVARAVISELTHHKVYAAPVVTEIEPLRAYSKAEAYHQHYYAQHPDQAYCAFVVAPKLEKFRKTFARLQRSE